MAKGDGFNNIFNNIIDKAMSSGVLDYFFGSRNNNNHYGYGGGYNPYGVPPAQLEDNTTKYILWGVLGFAFIFVIYMMFNNKKR